MGIIFDKPLIGVVMCQNSCAGHAVQSVHNKYVDAIVACGGLPFALPHSLMDAPHLLENAIAVLDGIFLTGSPSNIEPWQYGAEGSEPHADPGRDRLVFALLGLAIGKKMPLFGVCRGMQELVVANGGALWRDLSQQPQLLPHQEDKHLPLEQQYATRHDVIPEAGGLLAELLDSTETIAVNSLHNQGVQQSAPQLRVEARAPDGLIEAVSLIHHPFALAVQWHPEWQLQHSPLSQRLFNGFIAAAAGYHQSKQS